MGKKYTINSSGYAIAERDIHSLGGLVPKGTRGAKLASEDQLSQNGECWVRTGDLTNYPNMQLRDNAYIDDIRSADVRDSNVWLSGNTRIIPPYSALQQSQSLQLTIHDTEMSKVVKTLELAAADSDTTVGFSQGAFDFSKPAGTPLSEMQRVNPNAVLTTGVLIVNKRSSLMGIPVGVTATVLFFRKNNAGAYTYSGVYRRSVNGILDLSSENHLYAFLYIERASALTPAQVNGLGCSFKYLSSITGILSTSIAAREVLLNASNIYVTVSKITSPATEIINTSGTIAKCPFVLINASDGATTRVMGTFVNCDYIDLYPYVLESEASSQNNGRFISAYNCPLVRLNSTTMTQGLFQKANLVLRNCIVPKAMFVDDAVNGNTYEGIDFSYANAHLGGVVGNGYKMVSAHVQGLYNLSQGTNIHGQISRPENIGSGVVLGGRVVDTKLDGSVIEQGGLTVAGNAGKPFDDCKVTSMSRVRTLKLFRTKNLELPSVASGFYIVAAYYFADNFTLVSGVTHPTNVNTESPFVALTFAKVGDGTITPKDFIALNLVMRSYDFDRVPQVTGSGYIGAGVTASGDVQVHGQKYTERVFDANTFEQGLTIASPVVGYTWEELKTERNIKSVYVRSKDMTPVTPGSTITPIPASGSVGGYWFDSSGKLLSYSGQLASLTVPVGAVYAAFLYSTLPLSPITPRDAGIKYVSTFITRRYITNELDRVAAWDTLLGPEMWNNSYINDSPVGAYYKNLLTPNAQWISSIRPINARKPTAISGAGSYWHSKDLDPKTKLLPSVAGTENTFLGLRLRRDPISNISPNFAIDSRLVVTFVNAPRIVVPYGETNIYVEAKVRLTDNAVLGTSVYGKAVKLTGDSVMGEVPGGILDTCVCAEGEGDANIKYPTS